VGSVYRPTYADRHGAKRTSAVWWVSYYANGRRIFESTQTRDRSEAKGTSNAVKVKSAKACRLCAASKTSNSSSWPTT
jgi:hypothetical protein